jgi:hypothetical protein
MFIVERQGVASSRTAWIWFVVLCVLVLGPVLGLTLHIQHWPKKRPKVKGPQEPSS